MSAAGYAIHVSGLAESTTEAKLSDFFSFCGKLVSVKKNGAEADIVFEKLSAMRTSLMLNGGTLDGAHLEVTAASDVDAKPASVLPPATTGATPIGASSNEISQEDKPKAAIVAEYLAHGYVMGDHIVQRAIDIDQTHGISNRFLSFLHGIDHSVGQRVVGENQTVSAKLNEQAQHIVAKTKEVDQHRGVSSTFKDYYSKAVGTPIGQKVMQFYSNTSKQVLDVHEEARRIAQDEKKAVPAQPAPATAETNATTAPPVALAMPPL